MSQEPLPGTKIVDIPGPLLPLAWDQLEKRQRGRVTMLISKLTEFEAGLQLAVQVASKVQNQMHPMHRFMAFAMTQHLHGCFMDAKTGAQDVLRSVKLGPIADQIDARLDRPVGPSTFRLYTAVIRNTQIAHPTFDPRQASKLIRARGYLGDPGQRKQYLDALDDLGTLAGFALHYLRETYPIAAAWEDSMWMSGKAGPQK